MREHVEDNWYVVSDIEDFNLRETLECGQCFHFEEVLDDSAVESKVIQYNVMSFGKALRVKQIDKSLYFYNVTKEEYENIWKSYFDLDNDYGEIKKCIIEADPKLITAIDEKPGIRILNQDFFETLISFIISQNKQIPQIKQCVKNISHKFGKEIIGYNNETLYAFPDVEKLYEITEEELRECKVGFRAPYIKSATEAVYSGKVTKEKLDLLNIDDARELLMTIKGVGEKVANCVLLFGLGRREAFPVDVWMKRVMEQIYFDGQDMKKSEIEAYAISKFGKYSGYAQQYLFDYARSNGI